MHPAVVSLVLQGHPVPKGVALQGQLAELISKRHGQPSPICASLQGQAVD